MMFYSYILILLNALGVLLFTKCGCVCLCGGGEGVEG